MWALGELDIDFTQQDIGSNPGDLESEAFKKLNPRSRIPVLIDGDSVISESNTIVRYLFAEYGSKEFALASPIRQSHIERWMDWELATLQPDIIGLFWSFYRTPETNRDCAKIEYHQQRCASHLRQLDKQLGTQPYLAGETFSMADICCATGLYRYFEMGVNVEKPKNLMNWYDVMTGRADYRKNIVLPFGNLKGRLSF